MITFEETGKIEILDPDLFGTLLKYKEERWRKRGGHFPSWRIELRRLFGRLWLRLSPNIAATEFRLPSGATAEWFVSLLIRSRFGNLRLNTQSLRRKENN
jgi:hypothetical protein